MTIVYDKRNSVSIDGETVGDDITLLDPGANGRVRVRAFAFTRSVGGNAKIHFGDFSEGNVAAVLSSASAIQFGMGAVDILGPRGKALKVSLNGSGIFDGYVDAESEVNGS